MLLNIPFEKGQVVWVWENHPIGHTREVMDGYDHLGPKSKYETFWKDNWYATPHFFHLGLLDKFKIDEIFTSEYECKKKQESAF